MKGKPSRPGTLRNELETERKGKTAHEVEDSRWRRHGNQLNGINKKGRKRELITMRCGRNWCQNLAGK